ncbi:hypothetical protein Moror_10959 [Moniliophthora roreri MCA 2997]|uniref:Uncharacterized protein n=1 Tax=Moniliophthora roreri (strain MCA 2997) TaxID=1381753 RepID=V2X0Z9_MONRO|nr:hypothetical protein Moror_10959 [Moniliophthora roreri MCA 2997]
MTRPILEFLLSGTSSKGYSHRILLSFISILLLLMGRRIEPTTGLPFSREWRSGGEAANTRSGERKGKGNASRGRLGGSILRAMHNAPFTPSTSTNGTLPDDSVHTQKSSCPKSYYFTGRGAQCWCRGLHAFETGRGIHGKVVETNSLLFGNDPLRLRCHRRRSGP